MTTLPIWARIVLTAWLLCSTIIIPAALASRDQIKAGVESLGLRPTPPLWAVIFALHVLAAPLLVIGGIILAFRPAGEGDDE